MGEGEEAQGEHDADILYGDRVDGLEEKVEDYMERRRDDPHSVGSDYSARNEELQTNNDRQQTTANLPSHEQENQQEKTNNTSVYSTDHEYLVRRDQWIRAQQAAEQLRKQMDDLHVGTPHHSVTKVRNWNPPKPKTVAARRAPD